MCFLFRVLRLVAAEATCDWGRSPAEEEEDGKIHLRKNSGHQPQEIVFLAFFLAFFFFFLLSIPYYRTVVPALVRTGQTGPESSISVTQHNSSFLEFSPALAYKRGGVRRHSAWPGWHGFRGRSLSSSSSWWDYRGRRDRGLTFATRRTSTMTSELDL